MPNGKGGDHPLTDILHHNLLTYNSECDGLIREISQLVSYDELSNMFDWFKYETDKSRLDEFQIQLEKKLAYLKEQAAERGWE